MPDAILPSHTVVVFRLQAREYALPVRRVAEIIHMVAITPIPEAPGWMPGLFNLRGRVVAVMDVRTRLGMPACAPTLNTPMIVVEVDGRAISLIVDSVVEVITLEAGSLESPDALTGSLHPTSAIARVGERMIMILDLDRLCAGWESLALKR